MGFYVGGKVGPVGYSTRLGGGRRSTSNDGGSDTLVVALLAIVGSMLYFPYAWIQSDSLGWQVTGYTLYALYVFGIGFGAGIWYAGRRSTREARRLAKAERKAAQAQARVRALS